MQDNFQECRSEVENDYLTGMNLKKDEAKTFLAGDSFLQLRGSDIFLQENTRLFLEQ